VILSDAYVAIRSEDCRAIERSKDDQILYQVGQFANRPLWGVAAK
jgi:hypothetical protein